MPNQRPTTLTGAAGEHLVVAELLKRGFIAALVPDGVPNSDVVVTNLDGDRLAALQVKSRWNIGSDGGWHMKEKHETMIADTLFYAFIDFGDDASDNARIFVIPSAIVAELLRKDHAAWLAMPGKNGRQRKNGNMRRLRPDHSKNLPLDSRFHQGWLDAYENAWDLLNLYSAPSLK